MISFLSGQAIIHLNYLTVLVNGVGYKVFVDSKIINRAQKQKKIDLFIHTYVKEDRIDLYGFLTEADLQIFELVLSVSGVGPKTALQLVAAGRQQLVNSIQNAELIFFTRIPRVGKKMAQKIIIELRNKIGAIKELDLKPKSAQELQLIEALNSLGFDEADINQIVSDLDCEHQDLPALIKLAIKKMTAKK